MSDKAKKSIIDPDLVSKAMNTVAEQNAKKLEKEFNLNANSAVARGIFWMWFFWIITAFFFGGNPDIHDAILKYTQTLSM